MAVRFLTRAWSTRSICTSSSSHILRVCIVGSGPAGFYTAEKMLKLHKGVEIDMLDRLPTPFGLVRSGVAPDHPQTKIVINQFSRVAMNKRCSFFGNVAVGSSVSLSELRDIYHVVVLAYGAESDRVLGIPGENLTGIHSAREFVWWYNGHPDCSNLSPNLTETDTAVVLGQGNVALDVARILLRDTTELGATDIAEHALSALKDSSIKKVYLVGRRGPAQAACTAKELREILGIKNLHVRIQEADLNLSQLDEEDLKKSRTQRRVYELFCKGASCHSTATTCQREVYFIFFRKPDRFLQDDAGNKVSRICLEKTALKENDAGLQSAYGTGQFEELQTGLVLKSIGYKSLPIDGLPFDNLKGIVPNVRGRVVRGDCDLHVQDKGLYVAGWLKRGPTGIIATNLYCAEETVSSISEDLEQGVLSLVDSKPGRTSLVLLLANRSIRYVTFDDWERIDSMERAAGNLKNKWRMKITSWDELLRIVNR